MDARGIDSFHGLLGRAASQTRPSDSEERKAAPARRCSLSTCLYVLLSENYIKLYFNCLTREGFSEQKINIGIVMVIYLSLHLLQRE